MDNYLRTVISQYASAPTILRLIESFNGYLDPQADIDAFYSLIWNVDTAEGRGLDIWGRIVDIPRVITVNETPYTFGFDDAGDSYAPFNVAPFNGGVAVTSNYTLTDEAYRALILIKAATNIARTVTPVINALLTQLFSTRGRAYVVNLGDMKMRYVFEFYLLPYELAILNTVGALPQPTGVLISILQVPADVTFGFVEAGPLLSTPFGVGTFRSEGSGPVPPPGYEFMTDAAGSFITDQDGNSLIVDAF